MIVHRLNEINLVSRTEYLKMLCKNKRILHLGATDAPETIDAAESGRLLHLKLNQITDTLVGIDIDKPMIQWLSEHHGIHNIVYGDIENFEDYPIEEFDFIIAGEILEHLNNPGKALTSIHKKMSPYTNLIITVPNAYSLKGFLRALLKHELIHPDHTLHHSPHTLKVLLERHGFAVQETFSFINSGSGIIASLTNHFLRLSPQLAEGIGVICTASQNL